MAQNIYDDAGFFAGYSKLERSVRGLDGAAEWPALRALLPNLAGGDVVDLGCGFGWFARWARAHGARSVLGLDLSERMLARASADTDDEAIVYERRDLDALELPSGAFDLAFSSLTLHYLRHLDPFVRVVHAALRPGAAFVFSVEHPTFTAPSAPAFVEVDGRHVWPLDHYLEEGERITDWLAPGVVKQHRTIGRYVRALVGAGLVIDAIDEWGPSAEQVEARPDWACERDRPPFLLVAAHR